MYRRDYFIILQMRNVVILQSARTYIYDVNCKVILMTIGPFKVTIL